MLTVLPLLLQAASPPAPVPNERCWRREMQGTVPVTVYLGDRVCVDFDAPRTFEGLWVDYFEGQAFVEKARVPRDVVPTDLRVWLSMDRDSKMPTGWRRGEYGHVYRVTFRGRSARDMNRKPLEGYGHMGMSRGLVLVDQMLSIEDLGPMPLRG